MNREQLAHVLRAASSIVTDRRILVIGSQSILATYDEEELPVEATASIEVDLAFFDDDDEARADPGRLAPRRWPIRRGVAEPAGRDRAASEGDLAQGARSWRHGAGRTRCSLGAPFSLMPAPPG